MKSIFANNVFEELQNPIFFDKRTTMFFSSKKEFEGLKKEANKEGKTAIKIGMIDVYDYRKKIKHVFMIFATGSNFEKKQKKYSWSEKWVLNRDGQKRFIKTMNASPSEGMENIEKFIRNERCIINNVLSSPFANEELKLIKEK